MRIHVAAIGFLHEATSHPMVFTHASHSVLLFYYCHKSNNNSYDQTFPSRLCSISFFWYAYAYQYAPGINIAPPIMFPIVTGMRLVIQICSQEMFIPKNLPRGMKYMFATLCSNPERTKSMTGNHIASILPDMSFAPACIHTASTTSTLQNMPLMTA